MCPHPGLVAIVAVLSACGSPAPAQPLAPITWERPIPIATGGGERGPWQQNESRYDHVDDPSVVFAASGATVVAWVDHRHKDVLVQRYGREGRPLGPRAVNVSRTPDVFSWLPRLVVSPVHASDLYVIWQEIIFSGGSHGGDILVARSLDGGATFESPRNLSRSIGGDGKGRIDRDTWHNGSLDLTIGPDGTLYAAWTEYDGPLWFTRSQDRGATFEPPRQVTGDARRPARAPALV
nr:glycoside hydrolase [Myxococcota bacterium]